MAKLNTLAFHNLFRIAIFLLLLHSTPSLFSQVYGCTDPNAINYNPAATWNDGSCIYEPTSFTPQQYLELPASLDETSGLIFWAGGIWTFNDSGGLPMIYKVDTISGDIIQCITVLNAENTDWEDITQDEDNIYVGDFGNNNGDRKDLKVYKLGKSTIPPIGNAGVSAEVISFSYGDQHDFTPSYNANEYDCEAITCVDNILYLFTKNWVSQTTRLYELPTVSGTYSILPVDSFDVDGLITGAGYSGDKNQVIMSGYKNYKPFLFLLFDYYENEFFSGNKRRIDMDGIFGAQTEGICFKNGYNALLSCEKSVIDQQVFKLNTAEWTDTTFCYLPELKEDLSIRVHPNPVRSGKLKIDVFQPGEKECFINIYNLLGRSILAQKHKINGKRKKTTVSLSLPEIAPGIYTLHIIAGNSYAIEKIIIE